MKCEVSPTHNGKKPLFVAKEAQPPINLITDVHYDAPLPDGRDKKLKACWR